MAVEKSNLLATKAPSSKALVTLLVAICHAATVYLSIVDALMYICVLLGT